jgi:hypothetical protein
MEVLAHTQRVSLASFGNTAAGNLRRPVFVPRSQFCSGSQLFESAVGRQVLTASTSKRGDAFILRCQGSNGATAAPWAKKDARLVLEDGSVWEGRAFGQQGTALAEVVFNTSLTGYQEILTDPSYKGQFVVFTHPHIGNVGINFGEGTLFCNLKSWDLLHTVEPAMSCGLCIVWIIGFLCLFT